MTKNDPPQNTPSRVGGRAPRSVGTGHTGNPCEYPGCTDKNASLSTLWERPDQDHDFGGTNRELRCREHWGLDAPRAPRPREPLPVDPGWKVPRRSPGQKARGSKGPRSRVQGGKKGVDKQAQKQGKAKQRQENRSSPAAVPGSRAADSSRAPVDMVRLEHMYKRAEKILQRDPDGAAKLCARALEEEKAVVASAGFRAQQLMDAFRGLRRRAVDVTHSNNLERAVARESKSLGGGRHSSHGGKRQERMRGTEFEGRVKLERQYREAKMLATSNPARAIAVCDRALQALTAQSTLRDLFLKVRGEALRSYRRTR